MCSFMRYICMPNIKSLSAVVQKLWTMLKFAVLIYIWPLTLKDNLDLNLSPLKMCSSMWCMCMPNIKFLSAIVKICRFDLYIWPLTLKDDLDRSPLKMCSSMRYTCMPNIKLLPSILQKLWPMLKFAVLTYFDLAFDPWRMTLTLTGHHSKCASPWDNMHAKYQVASFIIAKVMANVKVAVLTSIFDLWPWRMTLTLNGHHSKYAASRDTHACQISNCYLYYF